MEMSTFNVDDGFLEAMLMAATTEQLFSIMRDEFVHSAAAVAQNSQGSVTDAIFDLLWKTYSDQRVLGVFELYLAARTDPELHRLLEPVVSEHFQAITAIARTLFPSGAENNPHFNNTVHAILLTMHGAALMANILPTDADGPKLERRLVQRLAQQELGEPALEAMTWKKH